MTATDDIRAARAVLGWLFEPGAPGLHDLVSTIGAVGAVDRLAADPPAAAALRPELRGHDRARLRHDATLAADRALSGPYRLLIPEDPDWPAGLSAAGPDGCAPVCLWTHGPAQPPTMSSVTVAGARACTSYGSHLAADIAAGLTDRGQTVVSSGDFGIAAAALRAALASGGQPAAVLPGGLRHLHPAGNSLLFNGLATDGLLISAWPPQAPASRTRQAIVRRLLAALTAGTVLIEAHRRGDTRQIVQYAMASGRVGMVVPGPVTSAMSAGCHDLLRADPRTRAVTSAADILADLRRSPEPPPRQAPTHDHP